MKLCQLDDHNITITVSRRNVLALLAKLHDSHSARTLFQNGPRASVKLIAEDNETHYNGRPAGERGLSVDASLVLQIATDLIEQVADGLEDDYFGSALDKTATQLAYLRTQMDASRPPVRVVLV